MNRGESVFAVEATFSTLFIAISLGVTIPQELLLRADEVVE